MVKKNYRIKKTISIKQFISEMGENFSEHMKEKLLSLEVRCVLTRKEDNYRLDLKHVEHTQHAFDCDCEDGLSKRQKEYVYGQFIVIEGSLYFSENCTESADIIESPIVSDIYNSLSSDDMVVHEGSNAKKINDSNIDYVIDNILTVCPEVTQQYLDVVKGMISLSRR